MGPTALDSRGPAVKWQRPKMSPFLLAHAAALAAMTIFMMWVFTHYRLVPYSQLQQLQEAPCSSSSSTGSGSSSSGSFERLSAAGSHALTLLHGSGSGSSSSSSSAVTTTSSSSSSTSTNRRQNRRKEHVAQTGGFKYTADRLPTRPTGSWTKHLVARLEAEKAQAQDPEYLAKLKAAVATPINVVLMAGVFWEITEESTRGCKVDGLPLDCRITNDTSKASLDQADALHYHVPSWFSKPRRKAFPTQLRLAMSLESSAYYEELDDPNYMCHFDAEMTYRHCAQVTNFYSLEAMGKLFKDPDIPQVPFEEKLHAIAYINSNCMAESGRSDLMRALMALGEAAKVPVHSYGNCDPNMDWPHDNPTKFQIFSGYKFCVTMENSLRQDYMSEKLWDGLRAGCIPVYLGTHSARDVVPDPNSFIMFDPAGAGDASTPEELDALMHQIGSDRQRYEAMMAWKHRKPEDQPNTLFKHLWEMRGTTGECHMCQFLARHRVNPQPEYTTCLFEQDWMATADQKYIPKEQACPAGNSYQRRRQGYGFKVL